MIDDYVTRLFAPGEEWAAHILKGMDLPTSGIGRVRIKASGQWSICDRTYRPKNGETVGGLNMLTKHEDFKNNSDLKTAIEFLRLLRSYNENVKRGHYAVASYVAARLGLLTQRTNSPFLVQAASRNALARDKAKSRKNKWQEMANGIWSKRPQLSAVAVATQIAKKLGGKADYIRRKISKNK
jgi:hypothetical protein